MYKKILCMVLFGFLIIGAASAAHDFIINDGFTSISEEYSFNNETGMDLTTWEYDDEILQEAYLQNDTDYRITPGDNNTYNVSYNAKGTLGAAVSYMSNENVTVDHGILEIAEVDGVKYIIMTYMDDGTPDDWKLCYDELMKFNENNGIEPLADAI
jgi:hypothetical protein